MFLTDKKRKEICERIERLARPQEPGNICPPPMDADTALQELCRYLLGEDWYTGMPMGQEQVNTLIVYEIETNYKGK